MVADLQPPLDCKKIALLGLCPTYDCVLMDSSTMFFALMQVRSHRTTLSQTNRAKKYRTVFLQNLLVRSPIYGLNSPLSCYPSQSVGLKGRERAGPTHLKFCHKYIRWGLAQTILSTVKNLAFVAECFWSLTGLT